MKNLVLKYLHNEISASELVELKEWLKDPKNHTTFKEIVRIQYQMNRLDHRASEEKALEKVLKQTEAPHVPVIGTPKRKKMSRVVLKYAAVFIAILALAYTFFGIYHTEALGEDGQPNRITLELNNGEIIDLENSDSLLLQSGQPFRKLDNQLVYTKPSGVTDSVPLFNTLRVPYGRTFEVVLSDGTHVHLNAGSKLTYPVVFLEGQNRDVLLEGEAFFKVAEDPQHPFLVNTSKLRVQVLGTRFNVSAYNGKKERTSVVLVSGKIAASVDHNPKQYILKPGDRALVEGDVLLKEQVNVQKHIAWTTGKIIFIDDPFEVITQKLERQYDVEIINKYPTLQQMPITGSMESKRIEDVLKVFQQHTPFDFKKKGRKIIITEPKN